MDANPNSGKKVPFQIHFLGRNVHGALEKAMMLYIRKLARVITQYWDIFSIFRKPGTAFLLQGVTENAGL